MGDQEEKKFQRPSPPKPLAFVPPKPPVLQPNISDLLQNQSTSAPPPPQLFANPFASATPKSPPTEKLAKPKDFGTEIPITPIVEEVKQITSPAYVEVSEPAINDQKVAEGMITEKVDMSGGLMGWLTKTMTESKLLSDVAEKAKAGMETVMTTLDPGMKPFLAGGDNCVIELTCVAAAAADDFITAAHAGFEKAGALVIVRGVAAAATLSEVVAPSLVIGEARASDECRKLLEAWSGDDDDENVAVVVAVQPFLLEIGSRCYATTKIAAKYGDVVLEAIAQLLEVDNEVLDEIEKNAIADDAYSITVGEAVQRIAEQNVCSFRPGSKHPPYNSPDLLVLAFASLAQQLMAKM